MMQPSVAEMFTTTAERLVEIAAGLEDELARLDLDRVARMLQTFATRVDTQAADALAWAAEAVNLLSMVGVDAAVPSLVAAVRDSPAEAGTLALSRLEQIGDDLLEQMLDLQAGGALDAGLAERMYGAILARLRSEVLIPPPG